MTKKNVPVQFGKNKFIDRDGYVLIRMPKNEDEKFKSMYKFKNMGYEHRINMAKNIGRPLERHEHVNHIDRNRKNNLITNLELIGALEHLQQHRNEGHFKLFTSTYNPSLKEKKDKLETLAKADPKELAKGILSESEHKDTVGNNPSIFAGIALDHLKEDPKYYTKLKKMESGMKKKDALQKNAWYGKSILAPVTRMGASIKPMVGKLSGKLTTMFPKSNIGQGVSNAFGKVENFAKTSPKMFSTLSGTAAGTAIGAGIGALKKPEEDENGNKRSRLDNALRGGAVGGLAGGIIGSSRVGKSFSAGFNNSDKVNAVTLKKKTNPGSILTSSKSSSPDQA